MNFKFHSNLIELASYQLLKLMLFKRCLLSINYVSEMVFPTIIKLSTCSDASLYIRGSSLEGEVMGLLCRLRRRAK